MSGRKQAANERRAEPRKQVRISVLCRSGIHERLGQLVNISLTGALLESSSVSPPPGTILRINFAPPQSGSAFELKGRVVRHTSKGFAITFLTITKELEQLVQRLL